MIIGTFNTSGDVISGVISTLTFTTEAGFEPQDRKTESSPDYRITNGTREIGAAWKKISDAGNDYYSVQIDDPYLPAPINCVLVKAGNEKGFNLLWERKRKQQA